MKKFYAIALTLLTLGLLSGCGEDGSSTPAASTLSLSGTAAVGYPIVNGTVQIKCVSGSTITTTTDNNGAYTATLSGQTLPCAVEVSGGTSNGIANTTKYHSIATATGTVNVTPLTDLMVANLVAGDPSAWFTALTGATLTPITTTTVNTALTNLRAALTGLPPLATINPITTNFTAISGNVSDDMLAALGTATATPGSYAALLGAAGIPGTFTASAAIINGLLPAAYAGMASGTCGVVAPGSACIRATLSAPVNGFNGVITVYVSVDNDSDRTTQTGGGRPSLSFSTQDGSTSVRRQVSLGLAGSTFTQGATYTITGDANDMIMGNGMSYQELVVSTVTARNWTCAGSVMMDTVAAKSYAFRFSGACTGSEAAMGGMMIQGSGTGTLP